MNIRTLLAAAAAVSAIATAASAQVSTDANVPVKAKIVSPITVSAVTGAIDFGTISRTATGTGTVKVTAAGSRSLASGASGVALAGGTPAAATIAITGEASQAFNIEASDISLDTGLGVEAVFTGSTRSGTKAIGSGTLGTDGKFSLDVGGDLTIASNATGGTKSGTMVVTFIYP